MKRILALLLLFAPLMAQAEWQTHYVYELIPNGVDRRLVSFGSQAHADAVAAEDDALYANQGVSLLPNGAAPGWIYRVATATWEAPVPTALDNAQAAANAFAAVMEGLHGYVSENGLAYTAEQQRAALNWIHYVCINTVRVAWDSTRTLASRQSFMQAVDDLPTGADDAETFMSQLIAAAATDAEILAPTSAALWVDPDDATLARLAFGASKATINSQTLGATPVPSDLIGRAWISRIPE